MITVELLLEDLSEKGKQKFKDAGIDPEEMNWDVIPLAVLEFEEDGDGHLADYE
jgi:hypothetical protein